MDKKEPAKKKISDKKTGLAKAEHYCAYQERSQQEVRNKLYEWGLWPEAVEDIISDLIQGNFLNEERFAVAYSLGKFRMKNWGRLKIKAGLKQKRVSEYCIKKGLSAIDPDDYLKKLKELIRKKKETLVEKDPWRRQYSLYRYFTGRGFEQDLLKDLLRDQEF